MAYLVAIDNGHGLNTAGKRCPDDSMREWSFNHAVAKLLEVRLEKCGINTYMVSDTSQDTPLKTRSSRANTKKATIFVSIHANAAGNKWCTANGIETLYSQGSAKGKVLADKLQKRLIEATGLRNRGLVPRKDIHVLRATTMPAALVECGFMDNKNEAALLKSEAYRIKCADAICKGICDYLGVKYVPYTTSASKPSTDSLYEPKDSNAVVTASVLNVRAGRGTSYKIVGKFVKNQKVKLLSLADNWWSVDVPLEWDKRGYAFIHKDYVKKTK